MARGDPSYAADSGLFSAPFSYSPYEKGGAIGGTFFDCIWGPARRQPPPANPFSKLLMNPWRFPKISREFPATSPEVLSLWKLTAIKRFPGIGESSRGNTIRGTRLRASERKSASERVSERTSENLSKISENLSKTSENPPSRRPSQRQISSQRLSILLPLIVLPLKLSPMEVSQTSPEFAGLPCKFPGLPQRSALSLGSLTPSPDSPQLSLALLT